MQVQQDNYIPGEEWTISYRCYDILAIILNKNGLQRIKLCPLLMWMWILTCMSEPLEKSKSFQADRILFSQLSAQAKARGQTFTLLGHLFHLYHMQCLRKEEDFLKWLTNFLAQMACKWFQFKLLQQYQNPWLTAGSLQLQYSVREKTCFVDSFVSMFRQFDFLTKQFSHYRLLNL